jgi:predicted Zn-dependent protease with MMP-like domain
LVTSPEFDLLWDDTLLAFERGEFTPALERLSAYVRASGACGESSYLFGVGALACDDRAAARAHFMDAVRMGDGWPEPLVGLADVEFRSRNLDAARARLEEARQLGPLSADGFALEAVLAEFVGDDAAATAAYAAAHRAAPDEFPLPLSITDAEFHEHVERAIARLPATFREQLVNVAIVVEPLPSLELLHEGDHDPEILGLYVGTPLTERSLDGMPDLPDVIYLFQRNLERASADLDMLTDEIAITVYHEIAHAFGFDEDGVADMGLE